VILPDPTRDEPATPRLPGAQAHADSIAQLFQEHNRKLVRLLVTRLKNEQDAKEVAQEAYAKLLQLDARSGAISYLRSYLFRIAENLAIDRVRQQQVRARIAHLDAADDIFEVPRAERAAIADQELALLKCAVAELPNPCREIFRLHKLADRPIEEVAALMGLKERMVRRHLRRALLYVCLRGEGHSAEDSWKVVP